MGINYSFNDIATKDLHGNNAIETDMDFSSKSELKKFIKNRMKNYICPNCGGHRMDGDGVIVKIGKVKLYHEKKKKGFFGGEKYIEEHKKDVYRIYNIYFNDGLFGLMAGYIKCKSCNWKIKAGKSTRWLSINDLVG